MASIFRRSPGRLSSSDLIQKSSGAPTVAADFFEAPGPALTLAVATMSLTVSLLSVGLLVSRRVPVGTLNVSPTFNPVSLTLIPVAAPAITYEADSQFITELEAASAVDLEPTLEKDSAYITEYETVSSWQAPQ